jgi:hypothetical protein
MAAGRTRHTRTSSRGGVTSGGWAPSAVHAGSSCGRTDHAGAAGPRRCDSACTPVEHSWPSCDTLLPLPACSHAGQTASSNIATCQHAHEHQECTQKGLLCAHPLGMHHPGRCITRLNHNDGSKATTERMQGGSHGHPECACLRTALQLMRMSCKCMHWQHHHQQQPPPPWWRPPGC